jgi:hypothetical protein
MRVHRGSTALPLILSVAGVEVGAILRLVADADVTSVPLLLEGCSTPFRTFPVAFGALLAYLLLIAIANAVN